MGQLWGIPISLRKGKENTHKQTQTEPSVLQEKLGWKVAYITYDHIPLARTSPLALI